MKKKIFGAVLIVAIAAGAMINVNLNKVSNKGDIALANVEALASGEVYVPYLCRPISYSVCAIERTDQYPSGYIITGNRVSF